HPADVGMPQPCDRRRLAAETLAPLRPVGGETPGKELDGHGTAGPLPHGFEHDPHPSASDLADQLVLPQPPNREFVGDAAAQAFDFLVGFPALQVFDQGEQLSNLIAPLPIPGRVFLDRGMLAAAHGVRKPADDHLQRLAGPRMLGIGSHGEPLDVRRECFSARGPWLPCPGGSPRNPGKTSRTCLSRPSARMYRPLAACSDMFSTRAVSLLLSSSKCRSASTSRSISFIPCKIVSSCLASSARFTALLGEVRLPHR